MEIYARCIERVAGEGTYALQFGSRLVTNVTETRAFDLMGMLCHAGADILAAHYVQAPDDQTEKMMLLFRRWERIGESATLVRNEWERRDDAGAVSLGDAKEDEVLLWLGEEERPVHLQLLDVSHALMAIRSAILPPKA